jgi:hypothetical protein
VRGDQHLGGELRDPGGGGRGAERLDRLLREAIGQENTSTPNSAALTSAGDQAAELAGETS